MATDSMEATSDSNQRRSGRSRVLTVKVREDQESKAVAKAAAAVPTRTIYKPKKKSAGPRFQFNPANRRNTQEAERNCDFTCHISVNKWYPTYKGRGQFNCPFSLMCKAFTNKGKAAIVRGWRELSRNQQKNKLDDLFGRRDSDREQEWTNPRKKKWDIDANEVDGSAQRPRKKRRTLADDRNVSGAFDDNEGAWERIMKSLDKESARKEKRNAINREKTQLWMMRSSFVGKPQAPVENA